ncbi:hypothetical protein BTUL_0274g00110 [Botrytis tulipae]|uniref:Uncharacterized protein n=1 Tax=Botrytis tulipae TaxID=87230 RepID=A0A4Z1E8B9_9HELO|nr:hypothetical protein BTUL_0274g00110 [Botrytis tulipae]
MLDFLARYINNKDSQNRKFLAVRPVSANLEAQFSSSIETFIRKMCLFNSGAFLEGDLNDWSQSKNIVFRSSADNNVARKTLSTFRRIMAEDLEPKYSETTKRGDENATERTSRRTSTALWSPCRGRNTMLRDSSIISGQVAQPQTFHSRMIAKGRTSRFVEKISSDEDLQSVVKNMGAAKTFDEMPLPPGKVRSATACEEQTKVSDFYEADFRRHY